jgi:hypothetical protein
LTAFRRRLGEFSHWQRQLCFRLGRRKSFFLKVGRWERPHASSPNHTAAYTILREAGRVKGENKRFAPRVYWAIAWL